MLKSTFDKVTNDDGLVTPAAIGCRVLVANSNNEIATSGILRFVGELDGQDGLFCGVELAEPFGKNDGSYRGVHFFHCPQNHGLFLPIHRVRLAEKQSGHAKMPVQRPDRLIKSVFPSISSSLIGGHQSMDVSMMSTNSSNWMEASDEDVDMFDSCTTYNVARPQFMLQEIEDPRPLISMDDEDEFSPTLEAPPGDAFSNGNICTSYVVAHSMTDRENLPVIGTPDIVEDLATPLVEENPINGNFLLRTAANDSAVVDHVPLSEQTAPPRKSPENEAKPKGDKALSKEIDASPAVVEKKEKKQRVSLKEMIASPPKAPVLEKPKKVSKQQQLMDQILQNMKEQKETPKKSARPKLSDLWNQAAPPVSKNDEDMTQQKSDEEKSKRGALKVINHPPAKPRNPPKPRQSLLPPPKQPQAPPAATSDDTPKTDGAATPVKFRTPTSRNIPGPRFVPDSKSLPKRPTSKLSSTDASEAEGPAGQSVRKSLTKRPVSQVSASSTRNVAGGRPGSVSNAVRSIKTTKKCTLFEKKLINHNKRLNRNMTVFGLIAGNLAGRVDMLHFQHNLDSETISSKSREIEHLQAAISKIEESYKEQFATLQEHHRQELEKLRQTKENEAQQLVRELTQTHGEELKNRDVATNQLQSQYAEAQKKIEELRRTLNEGNDQKITNLNLEIQSLQDMLEIKSNELTEMLKTKNRMQILQEKYDAMEKDFKALHCLHEQESFNFNVNRDIIRGLREESAKKDYMLQELELQKDKLEKQNKIYQQRVDELQSSRADHSAFDSSHLSDSPVDENDNDSDYSKRQRFSLLSTYQEAGRKNIMNESVHQDVIHCPEGRYYEDNADSTEADISPNLNEDPTTF